MPGTTMPRMRWPAPGSTTDVMTAALFASRLVIADARIDDRVEYVRHQASQYDHDGENEARGHDDRVVALEDRVHDHASHAGPCKDHFHEDGAAEQQWYVQAEQRDHGNERVTQRVLHDDFAAGQSLCPGRANVILANDFEHLTACVARYARGERESQR